MRFLSMAQPIPGKNAGNGLIRIFRLMIEDIEIGLFKARMDRHGS